MLNREESQLEHDICQLHETIRQKIASIGSPSFDEETPRTLQAHIQAHMTQLRGKMRQLELLAEEQET